MMMHSTTWKEDVTYKRDMFMQIAKFLKKEGLETDVKYDYNKQLITWTYPDFVSDHFIDKLIEEANLAWCRALEGAQAQSTKSVINLLKYWQEQYKEATVRNMVWKSITENENL